MIKFLKKIGMGIASIFVLPLYLVALAVYGAIGVFLIAILFIKSVYLFFTGRSLHDDLPEDKKAKEIINRNTTIIQQPLTPTAPVVQPTVEQTAPVLSTVLPVQQNIEPVETIKPQTVEEACFGSSEAKVEETPIISEPVKEVVVAQKEEVIEKYKPITNETNRMAFFDTQEIDIGGRNIDDE
jgi:hypothetical protein